MAGLEAHSNLRTQCSDGLSSDLPSIYFVAPIHAITQGKGTGDRQRSVSKSVGSRVYGDEVVLPLRDSRVRYATAFLYVDYGVRSADGT